MEPVSQYPPPVEEQHQYAPTYGNPPADPGVGQPGGEATGPRARIGVIVLIALVLELLLIGIGANQWVTDHLLRNPPRGRMEQMVEFSWLTFNWRFSPRAHDTQHWVAQTLLVVTVLVLTAALVAALLRGAVTWARAFFGTWLAVVFATVCGAIVRGLIDPYAKFGAPGLNRVGRALFSPSGPGQTTVVGGLALGFIVALLTSIVAVASRRAGPRPAAEAGPPSFPDYRAPAYAPHASTALPPWQDQHFGPHTRPPLEQSEPQHQPTTQLPPDAPAPASGQPGVEPTVRFPRPPDDEELGHVEH